jgi:uncharacterized lipoprotein NlpE involved in copper resistance
MKDINKLKKWALSDDGPLKFKHYFVAAAIMVLFLTLMGCTNKPKAEVQTYKPLIGKKCTQDSQIFSYFWLHTVYGPAIVRKEWCE